MDSRGKSQVLHFYVKVSKTKEFCYNVGVFGELTRRELKALKFFFRHKSTEKVFTTS